MERYTSFWSTDPNALWYQHLIMKSSYIKYLTQFLVVLMVLGFVPTLYFVQEFYKTKSQAIEYLEHHYQAELEVSQREFANSLEQAYRSVNILASNGILNNAVRTENYVDISAVQDFWLLMSRAQGFYSTLSFIDVTGEQRIRVDTKDTATEIVSRGHLVNLSDQPYFAQAEQLGIGELAVFVPGESAGPPSVIFITPIDLDGQRRGYFLAEINLLRIYQTLEKSDSTKISPLLLDQKGYYLLTPEMADGSPPLNAGRPELSLAYPRAWQQIRSESRGSLVMGARHYTFVRLALNSHFNAIAPLIMLKPVSDTRIAALTHQQTVSLTIQAIAIFTFTVLISGAFVIWNANHYKNSLESRLARAAMNGMSAVVITDRKNRIVKVNSEFTRLSGYTLEEVKGKRPSVLASGKHTQAFYIGMWRTLLREGQWEGEITNTRKDGSILTEILRIQTIRDHEGVVQYYVASFVDISYLKTLENQLRILSEKDALTDIWNRRKFDDILRFKCLEAKRYPDKGLTCLAIIDIDHFKQINDKWGHDAGDRVIRSIAQLLKRQLRETDFIARIGGEEFGIILAHTSLDDAHMVMSRLKEAVFKENSRRVSISCGVTDISDNPDRVYKRADLALYESKAAGRNRVSIISVADMDGEKLNQKSAMLS